MVCDLGARLDVSLVCFDLYIYTFLVPVKKILRNPYASIA